MVQTLASLLSSTQGAASFKRRTYLGVLLVDAAIMIGKLRACYCFIGTTTQSLLRIIPEKQIRKHQSSSSPSAESPSWLGMQ